MIVDDEPYNILSMQLLLGQVGYNMLNYMVDRAYNGKEALTLVSESFFEQKHVYGLIFMDLSMPILDGYEATQRIRHFYNTHHINQPKIIACTGHIEDEYIKKAWRTKIDEIAPKPINNTLLKTILDETFNLKSQKS